MTKVHRIVQVGLGGMGQGWLKMLKGQECVELVGLVDIRHEVALETARKYGLSPERAGIDLEGMLKALRPDAVIDVTIPATHKQVTLASLAAGCHVLGEKPLADTMENAREMVEAAKKSGKIYMVSQNRRWIPALRAIRQALGEGVIGKVNTVNCDFYIGAHFGGFRDQMEHPLLVDMAIHHFDMMRCLLDSDPEAVYCRTFNPAGSWYRGDAAATAIFEMAGPILFTYRGSWCSEGMHTSWNGSWRVVGDKGSIVWDGESLPIMESVSAQGAGSTQLILPKEKMELPVRNSGAEGQEGSLRRFLDGIESGNCPESWCGDNIKSLAMVFAAVESASLLKRMPITD